MAVSDANVFPGFLTPVLTQLFFPKPPSTFLTCFCWGERRKFTGMKSRLNQGSNSQPPGHESDTLTTEQPGRATLKKKTYENIVSKGETTCRQQFFPTMNLPSNKSWAKEKPLVGNNSFLPWIYHPTRGPWWSYIAHRSTKQYRLTQIKYQQMLHTKYQSSAQSCFK